MNKKIFLSVITCLITSCSSSYEDDQSIMKNHFNQITDFQYLIDHRTNLCFISNSFTHTNSMLTHVPCTQEVMNLIINK